MTTPQREDLMAEAVALTERIELRIPGRNQPIVIGFRSNGCGCAYFGEQPVFQFNSHNQLRRGYWRDLMLKAQNGGLASLEKKRQDGEMQLLMRVLSGEETAAFLSIWRQGRAAILAAMEQGECQVLRQVPDDADLPGRIRRWLESRELENVVIAAAPNVA